MSNKTGITAGMISFIVTLLSFFTIGGLRNGLLEHWFYNAEPYWGFLVSIIAAAFLSSTVGAIFTVINAKGKNITRKVWLMTWWFPVFVLMMEGINMNNALIHLLYSTVMESNEMTNGIVLIASIVLPFAVLFPLLKRFTPAAKE